MKKLIHLLLVALSFIFIISCNKDDEKINTNTIPKLTAQQKIELLNNFDWDATKSSVSGSSSSNNIKPAQDLCFRRNYVSFNILDEPYVQGLYEGSSLLYLYSFNEFAVCTSTTRRTSFDYSPETDKVETGDGNIELVFIDNNTIKYNDVIYYKSLNK